MVKRQYKIVYTNMLNIFKTVEYIQTYSLYSKKVSLRIIQIFRYSIIQYSWIYSNLFTLFKKSILKNYSYMLGHIWHSGPNDWKSQHVLSVFTLQDCGRCPQTVDCTKRGNILTTGFDLKQTVMSCSISIKVLRSISLIWFPSRPSIWSLFNPLNIDEPNYQGQEDVQYKAC